MQVSASMSTLARVATVRNTGGAASRLETTQNEQTSTNATTETAQQKQKISQLQNVDREVRAHEQAHLNAAQGIAVSGAHFQYQVGPDGKSYAVAGDVQIDTSAVNNNPRATLHKAVSIQHAALAPANPSTQDHRVANQAAVMARQAQSEIAKQKFSSSEPSTPGQIINQYT